MDTDYIKFEVPVEVDQQHNIAESAKKVTLKVNVNKETSSSKQESYRAESVERDAYHQRITIGVCAMTEKTRAPPMQHILTHMAAQEYIGVIMFTNEMILDQPVENWPICDCLIAFFSKGFPLDKAVKYVELRKPMVFNDLEAQYDIMDRRQVYKILTENGIEVPKHVVLNRNPQERGDSFTDLIQESDDVIEVGGQIFHKPFVEKPISAEDHNIYIYFPSDYGGGSQRLFRKVKNRSSAYSNVSTVRKDSSYIYEEFMATDGTDVKVYVVGPDYAHAEARKSPALDGKVERNDQGKEVRYPVILNAHEKLIARKVCLAFKQTVCGFDLLRSNGKSYVCDVNGFSFVKNSVKYYDDCAQILLEMVTARLAPHLFPHTPPSVEYLADEVPEMPIPIPKTGNTLELRCVVGVIRHGDRTPKQKMKMIVNHCRFLQLFKELDGFKKGHLKVKKPKLLQKVLDISRYLLDDLENDSDPSHQEIVEASHKLKQLRSVLEMYGSFSGINRKVQFKLLNKKDKNGGHLLLLILKWGGELTPQGQKEAEELGRAFRCMYPGGEGEYASLPGSGFLRLHSTYRHDLKVYASDEGRVQMTAAAFTKGMLDLEGNLASTLVHLVKRDQAATNLLDTDTDAQDAMSQVKENLHKVMRSNSEFTEKGYRDVGVVKSVVDAMEIVRNPQKMCENLYRNISILLHELQATNEQEELYHAETLPLMINRWAKLVKDFRSKDGVFNISKIPDIYDTIKYDMLHNRVLNLKTAKDVARCAQPLADIIIPQEYGITEEEKFDIGQKICTPLLKKIQFDLWHTIIDDQVDVNYRLDPKLSKGVVSPNRHVRSRLYFTSESHVHSLVNVLRHGGLDKFIDDAKLQKTIQAIYSSPELNYMTQIVFMLFEDTSKSPANKMRYRVDVHFSPGVKTRREILEQVDFGLNRSVNEQSSGCKKIPDNQERLHSFVKRLVNVHERSRNRLLSKSAPGFFSSTVIVDVPLSSFSDCESDEENPSQKYPLHLFEDKSFNLSESSNKPSLSSSPTSHEEHIPRVRGRLNSLPFSTTDLATQQSHLEKLNISRASASSNTDMEERAPGLELVTELASTIEPLTRIFSASLIEVNNFLTFVTGITLDFDPPIVTSGQTTSHSPHRSRCSTPLHWVDLSLSHRLIDSLPKDDSGKQDTNNPSLLEVLHAEPTSELVKTNSLVFSRSESKMNSQKRISHEQKQISPSRDLRGAVLDEGGVENESSIM